MTSAQLISDAASAAGGGPEPASARLLRAAGGLAEQPYSYDFFQAVRLLTQLARRAPSGERPLLHPVGHDYPPDAEMVRFRALPSHSFPAAEIVSFAPAAGQASPRGGPAEMTVSFFGLIGPAGALPQHYTQTVIDRIRLKDHTLRDFLDLFNHRLISLFYRSWEKHRLLPLWERAQGDGAEDPATRALYCLVGLGARALRRRTELADETFLYYAGLFAHFPRSASSLERMLAEAFEAPVAVEQFRGQWLRLEPSEQTALPTSGRLAGLNCQLGVTAIAGERVWSVESKFRIRLGPVGYETFRSLMPGSRRLVQVGQLVRQYVGPEFDFDVQPVLRRDETPPCQLGGEDGYAPQLGWNTWVCSVGRSRDADEAVFAADGLPTR